MPSLFFQLLFLATGSLSEFLLASFSFLLELLFLEFGSFGHFVLASFCRLSGFLHLAFYSFSVFKFLALEACNEVFLLLLLLGHAFQEMLHSLFFCSALLAVELDPKGIESPKVDEADRPGDLLATKGDFL